MDILHLVSFTQPSLRVVHINSLFFFFLLLCSVLYEQITVCLFCLEWIISAFGYSE